MAQAVEPIAEGPARQTSELEPLAVTAERIHMRPPKEEAVYPGRFLVGYLLIVLFFGALLAVCAIAWSQRASDTDPAAGWSTFRPTADGEVQRTREIARFVGSRYQTGQGDQIVRVLGGPPAVQNAPISQFLIRGGGAPEETIGADKAIMYILCGTGTDCALPLAASSDAHVRLVRREALELALYTMRFNDVDPVVVLAPPDPQGNPGGAFLFRRDDLERQLDRPLAQTLPTDKPPNALGLGELEAATVDFLTLSQKYNYDFQSAADGTARMVLNPSRPG